MTTEQPAPLPCPLCNAEMVWDDHPTERVWLHAERVVPCLLQSIALHTDRHLAAWNRRAPAPEGRWRGIESCPRDGTRVLLLGVYGEGHPGHWISIGVCNYRGWLKDDGEPFVFGMAPDFWQPLPAPPGATPAAGDAVRD